jgi:gluconate 2-dehydrogenase gamma chain
MIRKGFDRAPVRDLSRRGFMKGVGQIAPVAVAVSAGGFATLANARAANAKPEPSYESFSADEAAFVEAMVNVMCPADRLTPNGVACGLALFMDRQMAGGFGKGERLYSHGPWQKGDRQQGYQSPMTPEQYFKQGIAAADREARRSHGHGFAELPAAEANKFLENVSRGEGVPVALTRWFNDLAYPLFVQACFADPVYRGNRDKVFWKMIGYPGLPATYTHDMITYRGKPHPAARNPKSMSEFS